jgi:hypothetical protein
MSNDCFAPFEEIELVEILRGNPQDLLERLILWLARELLHREEMKLELSAIRINPSLLEYLFANIGDDVQLLRQLTLQGSFWAFSVFYFATGKFPLQLISRASLSLANQNMPIAFNNSDGDPNHGCATKSFPKKILIR